MTAVHPQRAAAAAAAAGFSNITGVKIYMHLLLPTGQTKQGRPHGAGDLQMAQQ
jgi:hypothetical protein